MRRAFFAILVALIPVLGTVKPATAQTVDDSIPALTSRAQKGDADAQNSLGLMYRNGQGVPQHHVLAHMWYNLAGAQGVADALKYRDRLASKMTPAQIAEAQHLAAQWQRKGPP